MKKAITLRTTNECLRYVAEGVKGIYERSVLNLYQIPATKINSESSNVKQMIVTRSFTLTLKPKSMLKAHENSATLL